MSIANELSSDVAVAVLAEANNVQRTPDNLTAVILEFHSTVQRLTAEARRYRRDARSSSPPSANTNTAASGNH